jgi:pullulanase/glycogen debranching enzyme
MSTASAVKANLKFLKSSDNVIVYSLNGKAVRDKASTIVVIHNANPSASIVTLPNGKKWSILAKGSKIGTKVLETIAATKISVPGQSTMVLTQ